MADGTGTKAPRRYGATAWQRRYGLRGSEVFWLVVGSVLLVLVGGALLVAVWHKGTYDEWPFERAPQHVEYCGRRYYAPRLTPLPRSGTLYPAFRFDPPLADAHEVYTDRPVQQTRAPGQVCAMQVLMRVDSGYVTYTLEGGP